MNVFNVARQGMMSEEGSLDPPLNCLSIPFYKLATIFIAEPAEEFALRKSRENHFYALSDILH